MMIIIMRIIIITIIIIILTNIPSLPLIGSTHSQQICRRSTGRALWSLRSCTVVGGCGSSAASSVGRPAKCAGAF